jgi:hypothetical protein
MKKSLLKTEMMVMMMEVDVMAFKIITLAEMETLPLISGGEDSGTSFWGHCGFSIRLFFDTITLDKTI